MGEASAERLSVYKNTVALQNTKRILNASTASLWTMFDSGYRISDAARDYEKRLDATNRFHERYGFDVYNSIWSSNPLLISDALGYSIFEISDEPLLIQPKRNDDFIDMPDIGMLATDKKEVVWTKLLKNKYPNLDVGEAIAMPALEEAFLEYQKFQNYVRKAQELLTLQNEALLMQNVPGTIRVSTPFEESGIRNIGFEKLSIALRRNLGQIADICEQVGISNYESLSLGRGTNPGLPNDVQLVLNAVYAVNPKQFELLYVPYLMKLFGYVDEYDKIMWVSIQSSTAKIWDFLKDAPKGHVMYSISMDDIRQAKEKLGSTSAISGGMPTKLLGTGTVDENIEFLKRLLDDVATDGAFILGQDMVLVYPKDAKRENLMAICEYMSDMRL
ncbi:MAG: hypothetical protein FWG10_13180 [Eubacteriaceae bacterium]|nr:hypothetical protein [Eubacteriaceae bacterium]